MPIMSWGKLIWEEFWRVRPVVLSNTSITNYLNPEELEILGIYEKEMIIHECEMIAVSTSFIKWESIWVHKRSFVWITIEYARHMLLDHERN